ncbi:hypothetical protein [Streptomyces sp. NPDC004065]|uniref:hypothetical protein n=1 Tax=Streptomyces sp. NPDC004065 TaxID=3364689 RepID=UPI00384C6BA7
MRRRLRRIAIISAALASTGLVVFGAPSAEATSSVIYNGGFEDGESGWMDSWSVIGSSPHHHAINNGLRYRSHTGTWKAELGGEGFGGYGFYGQQSISRTVTLDPKTSYVLSYWLYVTPRTAGFRQLEVTASVDGQVYQLDYRTNKDANTGYERVQVHLPQDLVSTTEKRVKISFVAKEDDVNTSPFLIDDVALFPVEGS